MSARPGVSVVVPVLNGAETLADTLASIAAQGGVGDGFEILVVDDGSRDRSRDVARAAAAYAPVRLLDGPRRGAAAAVNFGVRAARHAIVAQVDQDVVLDAGWLERIVPLFDDPAVGAVQGCYTARRSDSFFARVMALDLEQRYDRLKETVDHVCTGNSAYRADALAVVGGLNESLGYGYDNDLSYRLSGAGYSLRFCREARSRHRWRDGLTGYLTQQYGFGYGRLDVVAAHPGRLTGDDVSPMRMMSHPALATTAVACAAVAAWAWLLGVSASPFAVAAVLLTGGLAVERCAAGLRAWRRFGDPAALAFPVVHAARDLAWVAAIAVWTARRILRRPSHPSASMTPRAVPE